MNTPNEPEKMPDDGHPINIYIGEDTLHHNYRNSFQTESNVHYVRADTVPALLACVRDLDKEIQRWQNNLSAGLADVLPNAKRPFKSEGQLKHAATIKLAKEAE